MSVQDKVESILKQIHVLFAKSEPYGDSKEEIIVKKQEVFELLKELNLAVYDVMDEYEMTKQKRELAEHRSQKRSEEIVARANRNVDDIYAASILYTDEALSHVQHIIEDANASVQRIFRRMNKDLEKQKNQVRENQSELKEQLQDFADTKKYLTIIQEENKRREEDLQEKVGKNKGKKIPNEGKKYTIQPEIKINRAYFEQSGQMGDFVEINLNEPEDEKGISRATGKEFAEGLRRRAARGKDQRGGTEGTKDTQDVCAVEAVPMEIAEEEFEQPPKVQAEIKVDLDAEYFKWKNASQNAAGAGEEENSKPQEKQEEKRDWKSLFGRK